MIICKSFEVMKSYIIIFSVDCNTHLHTLNKKKHFFSECYHFPQKQRGAGLVSKWGENEIFSADRNFWPMGWPRIPKFGRVKKLVSLAGIFTDLLFELKSKKLCNFKDGQFGIFEKHGCPPLWNEVGHKANFYLAWDASGFKERLPVGDGLRCVDKGRLNSRRFLLGYTSSCRSKWPSENLNARRHGESFCLFWFDISRCRDGGGHRGLFWSGKLSETDDSDDKFCLEFLLIGENPSLDEFWLSFLSEINSALGKGFGGGKDLASGFKFLGGFSWEYSNTKKET